MSALSPGSPPMIELSGLARAHEEGNGHPLAIRDVFGDGFLLERLPPLARLRDRVVSAGYRFAPLDELPAMHSVLPLVLLAEILDEGIIPYRKNAGALLQLAAAEERPVFDALTFEDISPLALVHHESAHAAFFEVVRAEEVPGFSARGHRTGTEGARRLVSILIESEGFALAYDIFVGILAFVDPFSATSPLRSINGPPNHLATAERERPGLVARLAALAASHPAATVSLLAAAAYIANLRPFATNQVSDALAGRLAAFAGLPDGHVEEARALATMGLTIDPAFRQRLAPTLFRYLGIEAEFIATLETPLDQALAPSGAFAHDLSRTLAHLGLGEPLALPATGRARVRGQSAGGSENESSSRL